MIKIYTDGSSTKNRSGWGFIGVSDDGGTVQLAGTENGATNQRMELRAVLEALQWAFTPETEDDIYICSDSAYFCNCYFDKWYINWENNGWVNSKKEPIANKDLWEQIIPYFRKPTVHVEKVKGHSGHTYNEIADKLATGVIEITDKLATGVITANSTQLTIDEKDDKINIELTEILLDYFMKECSIDETIKRIRKVCGC